MTTDVPENHYVYLVMYAHPEGVARLRVWSNLKADSLDWVQSIEKQIMADGRHQNAVIHNWKRLRGDERWTAPAGSEESEGK